MARSHCPAGQPSGSRGDDRLRARVGVRLRAADDRNPRARFRQPFRHRPGEHAAAADHNRNFAVERKESVCGHEELWYQAAQAPLPNHRLG